MLRRPALALVTVVALGGTGACGAAPLPSGEDGPRAVLRAYGEALSRADAEAARALEQPSAHRGRDLEADRERLEDAPAELAALGQQLASAGDAAIRSRARIPLASGEVVVLARDPDGGWRIEGGILGMPALVTPREAVQALRAALERRHLRGIEDVLARRSRAAWEAEVARVLDQTEDLDALSVDVDGERATVRTPEGAVIELVLESGEWRVLDVLPSPASPPQ